MNKNSAKRTLLSLLLITLLLAVLPAASLAETAVTQLAITVQPPILGQKPDFNPTFSTVPTSADITLTNVYWDKSTAAESSPEGLIDVSADETFEEGYYYYFRAFYDVADGSDTIFADSLTTTINGKPHSTYYSETRESELQAFAMFVFTPSPAVAAIGTTKYATLEDAIAAAQNGDTVVLLADYIDLSNRCFIDKHITVDLNGKTIFRSAGNNATASIFRVRDGGKLTLTDSSAGKTGMLHATSTSGGWAAPIWVSAGGEAIINGGTVKAENGGKSTYALYIDGTASKPAKATLNGGSLVASTDGTSTYTVSLHGDNTVTSGAACFTMNGGSITSDYIALNGNGLSSGTTIVINDGEIISDQFGIYHPQVGTLTVNDGTIQGSGAAIAMKAGDLKINGGSILSTAASFTHVSGHDSGVIPSGAAIQLESNQNYGILADGSKHGMNITITNGEIFATSGHALYEYESTTGNIQHTSAVESLEIKGGAIDGALQFSDTMNNAGVTAVSGGFFTEPLPESYIKAGFSAVVDEYGTIRVLSTATPPTTGDRSAVALWSALLLVSALGIGIAARRSGKKNCA